MAIREDKDRRLGGLPEKLLTLEEAARRLAVPADDVEALIRSGRLSTFRLGGSLLRIRLQDLEALQDERLRAVQVDPPPSPKRESPKTSYSLHSPVTSSSTWSRLSDFFYFNDFYLVAILIALTLIAILFAL